MVARPQLRLSKKSKWPIPIIFAPLKINNLQATENRKMPRFRVFRQPRYISSVFGPSKRFRYDFHLLNWDASFLSVILNLLSSAQMNTMCNAQVGSRRLKRAEIGNPFSTKEHRVGNEGREFTRLTNSIRR